MVSDKAITNYYNENKNEKYLTHESVSVDYVLFKSIENDIIKLSVGIFPL